MGKTNKLIVHHVRRLTFGIGRGCETSCGLDTAKRLINWRTTWKGVTCEGCKRSKPKPKVHKCWGWGKAMCGLDLDGRPYLLRWPGVTCGNCLRHKPKRRKK